MEIRPSATSRKPSPMPMAMARAAGERGEHEADESPDESCDGEVEEALPKMGREVGLPCLDRDALELGERPREDDDDERRHGRGQQREDAQGGDLAAEEARPVRMRLGEDADQSRAVVGGHRDRPEREQDHPGQPAHGRQGGEEAALAGDLGKGVCAGALSGLRSSGGVFGRRADEDRDDAGEQRDQSDASEEKRRPPDPDQLGAEGAHQPPSPCRWARRSSESSVSVAPVSRRNTVSSVSASGLSIRKMSPAAAVTRYRSADRSVGMVTLTSSSEVSYAQPLSSTSSTRRGWSEAGSVAATTRSVACSIRPLRLPAYTSSPNVVRRDYQPYSTVGGGCPSSFVARAPPYDELRSAACVDAPRPPPAPRQDRHQPRPHPSPPTLPNTCANTCARIGNARSFPKATGRSVPARTTACRPERTYAVEDGRAASLRMKERPCYRPGRCALSSGLDR